MIQWLRRLNDNNYVCSSPDFRDLNLAHAVTYDLVQPGLKNITSMEYSLKAHGIVTWSFSLWEMLEGPSKLSDGAGIF